MFPRPIHIVTALPAEAKPICAHYGLQRRQPDGAYPVYAAGPIHLVLSGVGKARARAATDYLHESSAPGGALWINLGIAGHPNLGIGAAFLAADVVDAATGRCWTAAFPARPPCPTEKLITLDEPRFDYASNAALDMEGAGFFAAARRFASAEQVHCLKVVSDNRDRPGPGIGAKFVHGLIAARLELLDIVIRAFTPATEGD